MIWKILGAVMMLAASAGMGSLMASSCKRRIEDLGEVLTLIKYIKRQIETFLTPIDVILSSYTSEYLEKTGFADAMRSDGLKSAMSGGYLELSAEAAELLSAFAEKLGTGYADAEVKQCEYYISLLEQTEAREREKLSLNGRLYRFLPPIGVISLIILLI